MSISILDIVKQLLDMDKILYLPKTKIVVDEKLFNTYFNLVDHKTLLKLIEENDFMDSVITKDLYNILNKKNTLNLNKDINKYNNIQIEDDIKKIKKGEIYEKDDINKIKLKALNDYHINLKEINENILNLKEEV